MIKLKKLLKEDKYAFDRKFGDPLPTFKDVMETHQNKPKEQIIESIDLQSHYHRAKSHVAAVLNKASKGLQDPYKKWNKIMDKYRKKDRS